MKGKNVHMNNITQGSIEINENMITGTRYPNKNKTNHDKGSIPFDVTFKSTLKCGQLDNAIVVRNIDKTKEDKDAIPVDNTTINNYNDKNIKGDSGMPVDVTFKSPIKCG